MAIDPSISLGYRPPVIQPLEIQSPLDRYQKVLTLRGLMEQQQLRSVQTQAAQQKLEEGRQAAENEAAFRNLYADPNAAPTRSQVYGTLGTKGAAVVKTQAEIEEQDIKTRAARAARLGSIAGSITDAPTLNRGVMQAVSEKLLDPEAARQLTAGGWTPQVQEQLTQFGQQALTHAQQLEQELKNKQEERAAAEAQLKRPGLEAEAEQKRRTLETSTLVPAMAGGAVSYQRALEKLPPERRSLYLPFKTQRELLMFATTPHEQILAQQAADNAGRPTPPRSPERLAQDLKIAQTRGAATAGGAGSGDVAANIADAIVKGDQPPNTQGLYRYGAQVRSELGKRGYNLATAQLDWEAIKRHMATLNGAQQERLRQAVDFTYHSLDQLDTAYDRWKQAGLASGVKVLNRAALATMKNLPGEAGSAATQLSALIADMTSELGTVYKGGNSATDETLRLAAENLKGEWNEQQFKDAMTRVRQSLQIRRNSMLNSQAAGVSSGSPYASPAPPAAVAGAPQKGPPVGTVVDGHRFKGGDPNKQANWEEVKR